MKRLSLWQTPAATIRTSTSWAAGQSMDTLVDGPGGIGGPLHGRPGLTVKTSTHPDSRTHPAIFTIMFREPL